MTAVAREKKGMPGIPELTERQRKLKEQEEKDKALVEGRFHFDEAPGSTVKVPYRRYKSERIEIYELTDGQVYKLPWGFVRHLREGCGTWIHSHAVDDNGNPLVNMQGKRQERMRFEPLVFTVDGQFFT